eukprot:5937505-Pleurochrysis_carterae.AAC.1
MGRSMLGRTVAPELLSSDRDGCSKGGDVEQDGQHGARREGERAACDRLRRRVKRVPNRANSLRCGRGSEQRGELLACRVELVVHRGQCCAS